MQLSLNGKKKQIPKWMPNPNSDDEDYLYYIYLDDVDLFRIPCLEPPGIAKDQRMVKSQVFL